MKKILLLCFMIYFWKTSTGISQNIQLRYDTTSAQVNYAAKILQQSLSDKGYVTGEVKADYTIHFTVNPQELEPEAYEIRRKNKIHTAFYGFHTPSGACPIFQWNELYRHAQR